MRSSFVLFCILFIGVLAAPPKLYTIKEHVRPGYIVLARPPCSQLFDCAPKCPFDFMDYKCVRRRCHCQALPWQMEQSYHEYKDIFDAGSALLHV